MADDRGCQVDSIDDEWDERLEHGRKTPDEVRDAETVNGDNAVDNSITSPKASTATPENIAINRGTKRARGQSNAFLEKLHGIVSDPENQELICWSNDGDAIVIKKPVEFAASLLPKYFKHNNFQSFVRQLNTYSFRKTSRDLDQWEFKRLNFKREKFQAIVPQKKRQTRIGASDKDMPTLKEQEEIIQKEMCLVRKEVKQLLIRQKSSETQLSVLGTQYAHLEARNRELWNGLLKVDNIDPRRIREVFHTILYRQRDQQRISEQINNESQKMISDDPKLSLPLPVTDGWAGHALNSNSRLHEPGPYAPQMMHAGHRSRSLIDNMQPIHSSHQLLASVRNAGRGVEIVPQNDPAIVEESSVETQRSFSSSNMHHSIRTAPDRLM